MLHTSENTIKIISPAKVNLFLAVGEKQEEFHPVLNVMHSLLLHDTLFINYEKSDTFSINIEFLENEDSNGEIPSIKLEDNLIYKAICGLNKHFSKTNYKFDVFVEKNIPMQAGLAGGSSNAAAALIGAAKIFGISADDEIVLQVAKEIGSDVAFFLKGGCALYSGRGEIFEKNIQPMNRQIVILKPFNDCGLSTKDVYEKFDTLNLASDFDSCFPVHKHECDCGHSHEDHGTSMSLRDATLQLQYADNIPLFNNLAAAAESINHDLVEVREFLSELCGEENVLLCGSGSATFAIIPDTESPEEIVHEAKHKGFNAIVSQLANVKARIVPNIVEY